MDGGGFGGFQWVKGEKTLALLVVRLVLGVVLLVRSVGGSSRAAGGSSRVLGGSFRGAGAGAGSVLPFGKSK